MPATPTSKAPWARGASITPIATQWAALIVSSGALDEAFGDLDPEDVGQLWSNRLED
jgi:hypothetical protein